MTPPAPPRVLHLTALLTGTLTSNGRCLMLDDWPLLVPAGYWSWDGTSLVGANREFALGSEISVGPPG